MLKKSASHSMVELESRRIVKQLLFVLGKNCSDKQLKLFILKIICNVDKLIKHHFARIHGRRNIILHTYIVGFVNLADTVNTKLVGIVEFCYVTISAWSWKMCCSMCSV